MYESNVFRIFLICFCHIVLWIMAKLLILIMVSHLLCHGTAFPQCLSSPFSKQNSTSRQWRPLGEHVNNETTIPLLTHHASSSPWLCYREPATASSIVMAGAESLGMLARWSGYHGPQKGFMPRSSGGALRAMSSELEKKKKKKTEISSKGGGKQLLYPIGTPGY